MKPPRLPSDYADPAIHNYVGRLTMQGLLNWTVMGSVQKTNLDNALYVVANHAPEASEPVRKLLDENPQVAGLAEVTLRFISSNSPANYVHTLRVMALSLMLADALGEPPEERAKLCVASLLHDAGKLAVPDELVHRWLRLSQEEFAALDSAIATSSLDPSVKDQAQAGLAKLRKGNSPDVAELLALSRWSSEAQEHAPVLDAAFRNLYSGKSEDGVVRNHVVLSKYLIRELGDSPLISEIADIAGSHHENLKGTGYPSGISDGDIHRLATILMVADKFEAATSRYGRKTGGGNLQKGITDLGKQVMAGELSREVFEAGTNGVFARFMDECPAPRDQLQRF